MAIVKDSMYYTLPGPLSGITDGKEHLHGVVGRKITENLNGTAYHRGPAIHSSFAASVAPGTYYNVTQFGWGYNGDMRSMCYVHPGYSKAEYSIVAASTGSTGTLRVVFLDHPIDGDIDLTNYHGAWDIDLTISSSITLLSDTANSRLGGTIDKISTSQDRLTWMYVYSDHVRVGAFSVWMVA